MKSNLKVVVIPNLLKIMTVESNLFAFSASTRQETLILKKSLLASVVFTEATFSILLEFIGTRSTLVVIASHIFSIKLFAIQFLKADQYFC